MTTETLIEDDESYRAHILFLLEPLLAPGCRALRNAKMLTGTDLTRFGASYAIYRKRTEI